MEEKFTSGMSYKVNYKYDIMLYNGIEKRSKTPYFLLNKDKKITAKVYIIQNKIKNETEITCELKTKTNIILQDVSVTVILNNNDYYYFNLKNNFQSPNLSRLFNTNKNYKQMNNIMCCSCGETIHLMHNDLKIIEFIVSYNLSNDHINEKQIMFKNLYENGCYSDLTITIEGTKFSAHKIVLASNSEVLKNMIDSARDSDTTDKNASNIEIKDIEIGVFQEIFKYMYFGSCEFSQSPCMIFKFAHLYKMKALMADCIDYISQNIHINNIIDTLKLIDAYDYDLQTLKVDVNKYINKNENELVLDKNYIKYHLDYMRPNNVHYLFCLAMRYNLHEVSEKVKNFIKQNIKDVLKNKNFEHLMYKNPGWAYDLMTYCLVKDDII